MTISFPLQWKCREIKKKEEKRSCFKQMARLLSLQKYSADRHRADGMRAGMLIAGDNFGSAEWNRFRYQISRNGEVEELKGGTHRRAAVRRGGIGGFSALGGCCSLELMAQSQISCLPLLPPLPLSSCPLESSQKGWRGRDKGYILPFRMPAWKLCLADWCFLFGQ